MGVHGHAAQRAAADHASFCLVRTAARGARLLPSGQSHTTTLCDMRVTRTRCCWCAGRRRRRGTWIVHIELAGDRRDALPHGLADALRGAGGGRRGRRNGSEGSRGGQGGLLREGSPSGRDTGQGGGRASRTRGAGVGGREEWASCDVRALEEGVTYSQKPRPTTIQRDMKTTLKVT